MLAYTDFSELGNVGGKGANEAKTWGGLLFLLTVHVSGGPDLKALQTCPVEVIFELYRARFFKGLDGSIEDVPQRQDQNPAGVSGFFHSIYQRGQFVWQTGAKLTL